MKVVRVCFCMTVFKEWSQRCLLALFPEWWSLIVVSALRSRYYYYSKLELLQ